MDNQGEVFLISAMNQYLFNKTFERENNGKQFNAAQWLKDVDKLLSDGMFAISPEKQQELANLMMNLDDYAFDGDDLPSKEDDKKSKLVL